MPVADLLIDGARDLVCPLWMAIRDITTISIAEEDPDYLLVPRVSRGVCLGSDAVRTEERWSNLPASYERYLP